MNIRAEEDEFTNSKITKIIFVCNKYKTCKYECIHKEDHDIIDSCKINKSCKTSGHVCKCTHIPIRG